LAIVLGLSCVCAGAMGMGGGYGGYEKPMAYTEAPKYEAPKPVYTEAPKYEAPKPVYTTSYAKPMAYTEAPSYGKSAY